MFSTVNLWLLIPVCIEVVVLPKQPAITALSANYHQTYPPPCSKLLEVKMTTPITQDYDGSENNRQVSLTSFPNLYSGPRYTLGPVLRKEETNRETLIYSWAILLKAHVSEDSVIFEIDGKIVSVDFNSGVAEESFVGNITKGKGSVIYYETVCIFKSRAFHTDPFLLTMESLQVSNSHKFPINISVHRCKNKYPYNCGR